MGRTKCFSHERHHSASIWAVGGRREAGAGREGRRGRGGRGTRNEARECAEGAGYKRELLLIIEINSAITIYSITRFRTIQFNSLALQTLPPRCRRLVTPPIFFSFPAARRKAIRSSISDLESACPLPRVRFAPSAHLPNQAAIPIYLACRSGRGESFAVFFPPRASHPSCYGRLHRALKAYLWPPFWAPPYGPCHAIPSAAVTGRGVCCSDTAQAEIRT